MPISTAHSISNLMRDATAQSSQTKAIFIHLAIAAPMLVAFAFWLESTVMDAPLFWWPSSTLASGELLVDASSDPCVRQRILQGKDVLVPGRLTSREANRSSESATGIMPGKPWTTSDVTLLRYRCERDRSGEHERMAEAAAQHNAERQGAVELQSQLNAVLASSSGRK